jgi:cobalt-zinc-cadmium efflux system membrane fusion protein
MTNWIRGSLLPILAACAACGGSAHEPTPAPAAAAAAPAAPGVPAYFTIPEEQLAHIEVAAAHRTAFATEIKTTGTVDWDNDHTSQAITQVSGPITRILYDTGVHVTQGQPLLYVTSADITGAFSTYRKARNRLALAKQNLDRNKDLLDHKAIAPRDFEQVQADYNDAETDVETALEALKILGVSEKEAADAELQTKTVRPELPMRAPITGMIVQKLVNPGQVIQAGSTTAFVISNVATVWVQAHVYEKDLRSLRVGDAADVKSSAFPDVFAGRVGYIGNMLDPATRTTPVRIVTTNPNGFLKKDQFVDVTIRDKATHDALVVPTAAVLYDAENLPFVYVRVEAGKFAQRQVTLGAQQNGQTEITQGVKDGDPVVTQGSLFLQFANTYKD